MAEPSDFIRSEFFIAISEFLIAISEHISEGNNYNSEYY
jgi:hypothetical protein